MSFHFAQISSRKFYCTKHHSGCVSFSANILYSFTGKQGVVNHVVLRNKQMMSLSNHNIQNRSECDRQRRLPVILVAKLTESTGMTNLNKGLVELSRETLVRRGFCFFTLLV